MNFNFKDFYTILYYTIYTINIQVPLHSLNIGIKIRKTSSQILNVKTYLGMLREINLLGMEKRIRHLWGILLKF